MPSNFPAELKFFTSVVSLICEAPFRGYDPEARVHIRVLEAERNIAHRDQLDRKSVV